MVRTTRGIYGVLCTLWVLITVAMAPVIVFMSESKMWRLYHVSASAAISDINKRDVRGMLSYDSLSGQRSKKRPCSVYARVAEQRRLAPEIRQPHLQHIPSNRMASHRHLNSIIPQSLY